VEASCLAYVVARAPVAASLPRHPKAFPRGSCGQSALPSTRIGFNEGLWTAQDAAAVCFENVLLQNYCRCGLLAVAFSDSSHRTGSVSCGCNTFHFHSSVIVSSTLVNIETIYVIRSAYNNLLLLQGVHSSFG
jgi:hypothetical protein